MTLFGYHLLFYLKIYTAIKYLLGARHLEEDWDSPVTFITQATPCPPPLGQTPNPAAALASREAVCAYFKTREQLVHYLIRQGEVPLLTVSVLLSTNHDEVKRKS